MRKLPNNGPQHNPKNTDRAAELPEPNATPDSTPELNATPEQNAAPESEAVCELPPNVTQFLSRDAKPAAESDDASADMPDPFDPEAFRTPPEGAPGSGVEVQPVKLKVRNPKKTEFFRCHPALRLPASVLLKEDGLDKLYFLARPAVATMNPDEFKQVELCLCTNRDGVLFVWPIPQPSESGRTNEWHVSARDGAQKALAKWVRLKPDKANGQYNVLVSQVYNQAPKWSQPPMTLNDMLARAFGKSQLIEDEDHPELKALRGE